MDLEKIVRAAKDQGWEVGRTETSHWSYTNPEGATFITSGYTERRALGPQRSGWAGASGPGVAAPEQEATALPAQARRGEQKMEWSVNVEAAQPGDERVDQDALEVLLELLGDHHVGGVAVSPGRYGCRFGVDAATSLEAVTEADEVFRKAVATAGLPAWPVVRLEAISVEELDADLARATFPRLVGVAELAEILGVSRARASELASSSPDFPPPTVRLASGPVWTEPSVRRFIEAWRRRPGPVPSGRSAKHSTAASVQ